MSRIRAHCSFLPLLFKSRLRLQGRVEPWRFRSLSARIGEQDLRIFRVGLAAAGMALWPNVTTAQDKAAASPTAAGEAAGWGGLCPQPVTLQGRLYRPTCSGAPGTSTSSFAYDYRKGTADGLAVFFNGGGACWNAATCSKPRLAGDRAFFSGKDDQDAVGVYKAELLPGDGPARMTGLRLRPLSRRIASRNSPLFTTPRRPPFTLR